MRTKEQIKAELEPLQAELSAIEERERKAEHKALIGKCFKYHNSYGGDRPRWWMYARVTTVGGYWPKSFTFQVTCDDEIIVKNKESRTYSNDWLPITRKEFDREWRKVQAKVKALV